MKRRARSISLDLQRPGKAASRTRGSVGGLGCPYSQRRPSMSGSSHRFSGTCLSQNKVCKARQWRDRMTHQVVRCKTLYAAQNGDSLVIAVSEEPNVLFHDIAELLKSPRLCCCGPTTPAVVGAKFPLPYRVTRTEEPQRDRRRPLWQQQVRQERECEQCWEEVKGYTSRAEQGVHVLVKETRAADVFCQHFGEHKVERTMA